MADQLTPEYRPEKGWLERQFENVKRDVAEWPEWMRKESGRTPSLPSCEICTLVISRVVKGKPPRTCGHPDCIREHKRRYKVELREAIREVNVYTRGGEDELDRKMNEYFREKGWDD